MCMRMCVYQANLSLLNKEKSGPKLEEFLEFFKPPHTPDMTFYNVSLTHCQLKLGHFIQLWLDHEKRN